MLVNGIVWCIAWWAALLLCKRSLAVFVGSLELLSNCPQCVLLQISVWLYVIRDRDTRTHTRIHTCPVGCAPLLTPQRNCDPFSGAIDTTQRQQQQLLLLLQRQQQQLLLWPHISQGRLAKRCRDKFDNNSVTKNVNYCGRSLFIPQQKADAFDGISYMSYI